MYIGTLSTIFLAVKHYKIDQILFSLKSRLWPNLRYLVSSTRVSSGPEIIKMNVKHGLNALRYKSSGYIKTRD